MKNLLFLSLMLLTGAACFGQGRDYMTWEESGCDIDNYVLTNFDSNQDRYIGQKLSKLLDDIELSVRWGAKLRFRSTRDSTHFIGIYFFIKNPTFHENRARNIELRNLYQEGETDKAPLESYYITIDTERIYIENVTEELIRKGNMFLDRDNFPADFREAVITRIDNPWKKSRGY